MREHSSAEIALGVDTFSSKRLSPSDIKLSAIDSKLGDMKKPFPFSLFLKLINCGTSKSYSSAAIDNVSRLSCTGLSIINK